MLLTDTFIEKYKTKTPPFGGNGLGELVYLRTYSRWIPELQRREHWYETVRRVVEYSMSLYSGPARDYDLRSEAERLYDSIFNLRLFPAGRSLWIGGTKAAEKFPLSNFNCTFKVVDSFEAFTEVFYLLMLGCGTGFRVLPEDVEQIPAFQKDVPLYFINTKTYSLETLEHTVKDYDDGELYIAVGDSKEGWVGALEVYLSYLFGTYPLPLNSITINTHYVRPKGAILKTFGGRASGPEGLIEMFTNIHKVINSIPDTKGFVKLRPIDALDIMNIIAYNVVVGGVRRSSQIALFDINDQAILDAKIGVYTPGHENYGKFWRAMSNNSIYFTEKPTKKQLLDIFDRISHNGEPGFLNAKAASERRPNFAGINPCAEILLDNNGVCNLSEINLTAFIDGEDGKYYVNYYDLYEAITLAVRIGLRQTNVNLELIDWDRVQKRDRLIGVSLTGMEDFFDRLGWKYSVRKEFLKKLSLEANNEAVRYAKEMRVPAPLLTTTVKPSGTLSQLPTVSSGAHRSFAPYYIRRVRVTSTDPLARVMRNLSYPVYPETGQGPSAEEFDRLSWDEQDKALEKANTWVVEFPVKTDTINLAENEPAISQFQRYLDLQSSWTDHNTSITIYFDESEVEPLVDTIRYRWDDYIAVSFLPKNTTAYPLMPYEVITEDEYNRRSKAIVRTNVSDMLNLLEKQELLDDELDPSCATGVCPPR